MLDKKTPIAMYVCRATLRQ